MHEGAHRLLEHVRRELIELDCLSTELFLQSQELALFRIPSGLVVSEGPSRDTYLAKSLNDVVSLFDYGDTNVNFVLVTIHESRGLHDRYNRARCALCSVRIDFGIAFIAEELLCAKE